jgi:hypothetical protein
MATLAFIKKVGGKALEGSAREIDESDVDGEGQARLITPN